MQILVEVCRAQWGYVDRRSVRIATSPGEVIARFSRVRCSPPSSVEVQPTDLTSRNGSRASAEVRLFRTYKQ